MITHASCVVVRVVRTRALRAVGCAGAAPSHVGLHSRVQDLFAAQNERGSAMTGAAGRKSGLFSRIETREEALKMVRDASIGFFVLAGIQGLLGYFLTPALMVDAGVLALLGTILMKWCSRAAAILLLLFSVLEGVITLLNRLGVMSQGGTNVLLAAIMVVSAVRAVEATFKLHGRFATPQARAA